MKRRYVIIGAGQAGCSAAAKLRELDKGGLITIIGAEAHLPYQRPPLSKKYMTGEMDAARLLLRPVDWYRTHQIEAHLNCAVASIDRLQKTICLEDGTIHPYDRLLIASGSKPRTLPKHIGGNLGNVMTIRGLDDADQIKPQLRAGKKALVVGGGYIGLEAAAVLRNAGMDVVVVEMAGRILQRVAGPATSEFIRNLHTEHGALILENIGLQTLIANEEVVAGAKLSDGQLLVADLVLVGIGVEPCSDIAGDAGLECDNGIKVNEYCQTDDGDIYAAGDCANFPMRGRRVRLESVQNAIEQSECAARNMVGEATIFDPVPWFWSDQYELKLQIAGLNTGYDSTVVRPGTREGAQSVWYFKNKQFISVDCMNDPRAYMVGKKILELGGNISPQQAADGGNDLKAILKSQT